MKYLKTKDGDYVKTDSINRFSARNKKVYALTNDDTFILKEFDTDDDAQAYLDELIKTLEDEGCLEYLKYIDTNLMYIHDDLDAVIDSLKVIAKEI